MIVSKIYKTFISSFTDIAILLIVNLCVFKSSTKSSLFLSLSAPLAFYINKIITKKIIKNKIIGRCLHALLIGIF